MGMRRTPGLGILLLLWMGRAHAQTLRFDVVSVRIAEPQEDRVLIEDTGRIDFRGITLIELIMRAFDVPLSRIVGPNWLPDADSTYYAVTATVPPKTTKGQRSVMLQTLLTERFHLAFHREDRPAKVYALRVAKGGLKVRRVDERGAVCVSWAPGDPWRISGRVPCPSTDSSPLKRAAGGGMTIDAMIEHVPQLDRAIVDRTGLDGYYDVEISIPRDTDGSITTAEVTDAMRKQLGLRMERERTNMSVIVIDHIEARPTPN